MKPAYVSPAGEAVIAEKVPVAVDIERLRRHVTEHVLPVGPPVMQSSSFGGWSVLSQTGHWRDGWEKGHRCVKTLPDGSISFDPVLAKQFGLRHDWSYDQPTEICHGYLAELMDQIAALGLYPRRARLSILEPGGSSSRHRDGADDAYSVRMHIPIFTNTLCTFETDDGSIFLPADGSAFLVGVNRMHQIFNRSAVRRINLLIQVWDTRPISQYFAFTGNIEDRASEAKHLNALIASAA